LHETPASYRRQSGKSTSDASGKRDKASYYLYVIMERTITISDEVYEELLKVTGKKSPAEALGKLVKKEGNLGTLQIGFGSRTGAEKERLHRDLRELEEQFQHWI